jgi:hypothetical protein
MICSTQPSLEEILDKDTVGAISPSSWFEQLGDTISEQAGCGALLEETERQLSADQRMGSFEMGC